MVARSVLAGVQLIMLGLIGEYLGRLFLSANRKPQFVVRGVEMNDLARGTRPQLVVHEVERAGHAVGEQT